MSEQSKAFTIVKSTGSAPLDLILKRLRSTNDPRRRYEYILWLAKKLQPFPIDLRQEIFKVKGCVSNVYVVGELKEGIIYWKGDSDAQITKGLLALLNLFKIRSRGALPVLLTIVKALDCSDINQLGYTALEDKISYFYEIILSQLEANRMT